MSITDPPPPPTDIRAAISAAMQRQGMTQTELAEHAGTTQAQVSAYLAGKRDPAASTIERWLNALGLSIE